MTHLRPQPTRLALGRDRVAGTHDVPALREGLPVTPGPREEGNARTDERGQQQGRRSGGDRRVAGVLRRPGQGARGATGHARSWSPQRQGRCRRPARPTSPLVTDYINTIPVVRGAGVRRQRGDRAALPQSDPLERRGAGAPGPAFRHRRRWAHLHLRRRGHALRGRSEPLLPRARSPQRWRPGVLPGPRLAGHVRPRLPRGSAERGGPERVPAGEVEGAARAVVVPAPAADAGVLAVPHGVHGHRPDERDLPGPVQPLPAQPRHQGHVRPARVGVPRRRRDGRARVARSAAARRQRRSGQPDLRDQLQPAATGRSGARQRQDRAGAGGVLPGRRLGRDQGPVGAGVGSALRRRQHR